MHESHTCGSKIVISRIQTNFSRLTDNSESNCLKTDQIKNIQLFFDVREVVRTSSGLLNNARDWLEVLKSLKIFLQLRLSSEVVGKSSEVVANIRRSSEVFRNLRQSSEDVDEKCHAFYWKKIGRYTPAPPCTMHLNTLTGPDLYTGLQWQIPSDGSNLRRGMALID